MTDQFSVHANPGRDRRRTPFVLVVQSNRFRASLRRIVVPMVAAEDFGAPDSDIGPHFEIEGVRLILDPLQITNVPREVLGPSVASFADDDHRIVNAIDAVFNRAWR